VLFGIGKVECSQGNRKLRTINEAVDRSPLHGRLGEERNGRAADGQIEPPGRSQNGVPEGFEVDPLSIHPPEQAVLRVDISRGRLIRAGLLIRT
jgi:hypothetical protein